MKNWIKLNHGIEPTDVSSYLEVNQSVVNNVQLVIDNLELNETDKPLAFVEIINPEDMVDELKSKGFKFRLQCRYPYAVNYIEVWSIFTLGDIKVTIITAKDGGEDHSILISDVNTIESL